MPYLLQVHCPHIPIQYPYSWELYGIQHQTCWSLFDTHFISKFQQIQLSQQNRGWLTTIWLGDETWIPSCTPNSCYTVCTYSPTLAIISILYHTMIIEYINMKRIKFYHLFTHTAYLQCLIYFRYIVLTSQYNIHTRGSYMGYSIRLAEVYLTHTSFPNSNKFNFPNKIGVGWLQYDWEMRLGYPPALPTAATLYAHTHQH